MEFCVLPKLVYDECPKNVPLKRPIPRKYLTNRRLIDRFPDNRSSGMVFARHGSVTIFDSLVIYLTLGAPFAVYRFFQLSRPIRARSIALLAFSFLFWPPSAYHLVRRSLSNSSRVSHFVTRKSLDARIITVEENFRSSLERAISNSLPDNHRRSFMALLDRYVGLRLAVEDQTTGEGSLALFEISGHAQPRLAAICFDRLNRIRLERHSRLAQRDLLASIHTMEADKELTALTAQLAGAIGDSHLASALNNSEATRQRHAETAVREGISRESMHLTSHQTQEPVSLS